MNQPTTEETAPATSGRRAFLGRAAIGGIAAAAAMVPLVGAAAPASAAAKPAPPAPPAPHPNGHHRVFDVQDFGAKGNGTHDDTVAIQKAITAAQAAGGGTVYLPSGKYKTTSTLKITGANITVEGEGASSIIACAFAAGDILRIARTSPSAALVANGLFTDFAIISTVKKTSGAALAMDGVQDMRICNVHAVSRVYSDPNNLWDSFTFHDFTIVVMENCKIQAQNKGITCWGNQVGADIWITGGTLCSFTPIGVHVGGGVGGVYFDEFLCYLNGTNVLIDDTLAGSANRELIFNEAVFDGSYRHNVEIMQNGVYVLTFQNTWFGNSGFDQKAGHPEGCLIRVHPGGILHPSNVTVSGCKMFNAYGSGIFAESGAWTITGSDISLNGQGAAGGYGVILGAGASGTVISGNSMHTNGNYPSAKPVGVGIKIASGVNDYIVTSNSVIGNGTAGLVDEGGPSKIVDLNLGA
ncbi:MAG: right-handed parallel beta-helix repeat-containing protein [Microbacterium sp.]|uniref:glycosyl hydrolase family 28-related protein n=1 Tax=Microbacterium sp. TaxID=51671 RepID=UPI001AC3B2B3|nr:glycosyl hydrolase family 28-related protein [Microbacterium sp.]MBN9155801.1 right-handed parallel beta-helix repeat-containing protein [Microbacterium sp.]